MSLQGTVEIKNMVTGKATIKLFGGALVPQGATPAGEIELGNDTTAGFLRCLSSASNYSIMLNGKQGSIVLRDANGTHSFTLMSGDADRGANMWIGGIPSDSPNGLSKSGYLALRDGTGHDSIQLDGHDAILDVGQREEGNRPGWIQVWSGGKGVEKRTMVVDGSAGNVFLRDKDGTLSFTLESNEQDGARMWIGGIPSDSPNGLSKPGYLVLRDGTGNDSILLDGKNAIISHRHDGKETLRIDGGSGDITLQNADCAEEFDISPSEMSRIEPGTVMSIDDGGALQVSSKPYDKRVAGVISGGGNFKPGIVLDKKKTQNVRAPLAMLGKVFCKVDADQSPIKVGDMLTTSKTSGHAMKATNRTKAFGSVIGKALYAVKSGKALIPILIALQ